MSWTWKNAYKTLATEIDATLSDRPNDVTHIHNGLLAISALSSMPDGSEESYGTEATTTLLLPMNSFYYNARHFYVYDYYRINMVKLINDFTVKYFGDLTVFVNSIDWDYGCVPYYWAELCEQARFDTSGWTVCS